MIHPSGKILFKNNVSFAIPGEQSLPTGTRHGFEPDGAVAAPPVLNFRNEVKPAADAAAGAEEDVQRFLAVLPKQHFGAADSNGAGGFLVPPDPQLPVTLGDKLLNPGQGEVGGATPADIADKVFVEAGLDIDFCGVYA